LDGATVLPDVIPDDTGFDGPMPDKNPARSKETIVKQQPQNTGDEHGSK
jgi:hypothetical protein